jgi:hypothetical protein
VKNDSGIYLYIYIYIYIYFFFGFKRDTTTMINLRPMKGLVLINTVRTGGKWSECEADDSFPSVKTRKCVKLCLHASSRPTPS